MTELLRIENLSAGVEEKQILKNINLKINYGEVHVIMGPNGSGKSTLANVIMDNPVYNVTSGKIFLDGEDITDLTTDKRANKGLFMSFQTPEEVPGISVENFIRTAKSLKEDKTISILKFKKEIKKEMEELKMDSSYAERYLNVGFSGGEKKKNEILQMLMLKPKLAILDETDSGLDVDATRIVSSGIEKYLNEDNAVLIITHHKELIDNIKPDFVHVVLDGEIVKEGDASLIDKIEKEGFNWIREEVK
ncbi:FeS assembly ATPase SufC [Peptoniphilus harei ACS-146-V-Sch2b]|uniref:FeS assembly ATPase SufC n=1 Tax=Peptoniphilus harei ACS-146-V-Sch2b TaxID=908338 RepID=E4KXZ7_9FIRM|nr:Fe-S cluster assembly ATPase SufC [Peptoniphilus harei]EFR33246.1 FeS assembly ATPase SufC [Peptoniphilus harei ACS-146-V-Sch2b]MDU3457264.1 Fe-S cluster assembly ATPase SufC [Peptoniphilus harei]MDU5184473.1 Fe-S cluster assembly ATPase SufC [Peptoniphilus harei]MDU7532620.1 Fe-S cluster assembly ATPase SufC [Peptoniphilus harei]